MIGLTDEVQGSREGVGSLRVPSAPQAIEDCRRTFVKSEGGLDLFQRPVTRRAEYFDGPAIREIARRAEADGYRMSAFVLGVVESDAFRMARPRPAPAQQTGANE